MCNCIETTEKQLKEHLEERLKERKIDIVGFENEHESGIQSKALSFTNGEIWCFPVEYKYVRRKKDGTPERRATTYKQNLMATFCPICGVKINYDKK